MPVDYKILNDDRVTYVRYSGEVDADQIIGALKRYMDEPGFRADNAELVDLRAVSNFDLTYRSIARVFQQTLSLAGEPLVTARKVFLAPSDQAHGLSRLYKNIADTAGKAGRGLGGNMIVARSESEALESLGVAADSVTALLSARAMPCDQV